MKEYIQDKIEFYNNEKIYPLVGMYKNIQKEFQKINYNKIKMLSLLDYNIQESPTYFLLDLLEIRNLLKQ